jgi:hypothetical protein
MILSDGMGYRDFRATHKQHRVRIRAYYPQTDAGLNLAHVLRLKAGSRVPSPS